MTSRDINNLQNNSHWELKFPPNAFFYKERPSNAEPIITYKVAIFITVATLYWNQ
jgi:hypothetical protein